GGSSRLFLRDIGQSRVGGWGRIEPEPNAKQRESYECDDEIFTGQQEGKGRQQDAGGGNPAAEQHRLSCPILCKSFSPTRIVDRMAIRYPAVNRPDCSEDKPASC